MSEAITFRDFLKITDPDQGIRIMYTPSTANGRNLDCIYNCCADLLTEDWIDDYFVKTFRIDEDYDPEYDGPSPEIQVYLYDKKIDYAMELFEKGPDEETRLKAFIQKLKKQRDELRKSGDQESFIYGRVSQLNLIIYELQRELWKL